MHMFNAKTQIYTISYQLEYTV